MPNERQRRVERFVTSWFQRRVNEIDELQLEHRTLPVRRKPAGNAKNGRFRERRIEDLLRKFGRELLRQAKDAAFRIFNVFAKDDAARIFSRPARSVLFTVSPMRYLPGGSTSSSS